tara:strand:+ start:403 stop:618 length:216 start_codon:yes stop_codon:yes gene_type:complete
MLDFSRTWLPFLYLYFVGGIAFTIGMILIIRSKALKITYYVHKKWIFILLYGFIFYSGIHALFIYLAIGSQ